MYAAIDEQDKVYTSGSETYAQIQPMVSEVQRQTQHEQIVFCQPLRAEEVHSAPQPPSVDSLRHVAHAHSRQGNKFCYNNYIIQQKYCFNDINILILIYLCNYNL